MLTYADVCRLQMVYSSKRYNKMRTIASLSTGHVFGSSSVLEETSPPLAASITATSDSTLILVTRECLLKVAKTFSVIELLPRHRYSVYLLY